MKPVFTEKCFYILPSFVSNIHTHIRFGGSSLFLLCAYPLAFNYYASYLSVGSDETLISNDILLSNFTRRAP